MNLIGMSLDGDDEPEHVRVRRVRTRSASTPGFGVAAVMRALAVIIEGVKQLVYTTFTMKCYHVGAICLYYTTRFIL